MPARNKNRLAPLTIKPPKLRKYAAQSREKRRLCHQKPAAAAQYSAPHPARDHTNTPRQQLKKRLTGHYPPPGASKKLAIKQQNAENASVSTETYSAARRNVAIQPAPLPTKIRQYELILCHLQGKCGHPRQKAAIQNSAVRWQNSLTPPAIAANFLTPTGCLRSLFARIMQENGVFYAINPTKLRHFTPDLRRLRMFRAIICCPSVKHSNFSKKICVTSGAEKFGRKTADFSIKIFRSKPEISRRCPILPRFSSEKPH